MQKLFGNMRSHSAIRIRLHSIRFGNYPDLLKKHNMDVHDPRLRTGSGDSKSNGDEPGSINSIMSYKRGRPVKPERRNNSVSQARRASLPRGIDEQSGKAPLSEPRSHETSPSTSSLSEPPSSQSSTASPAESNSKLEASQPQTSIAWRNETRTVTYNSYDESRKYQHAQWFPNGGSYSQHGRILLQVSYREPPQVLDSAERGSRSTGPRGAHGEVLHAQQRGGQACRGYVFARQKIRSHIYRHREAAATTSVQQADVRVTKSLSRRQQQKQRMNENNLERVRMGMTNVKPPVPLNGGETQPIQAEWQSVPFIPEQRNN